ncbi:hypothetical protein [Mesorhizobium sp. WSM4983]
MTQLVVCTKCGVVNRLPPNRNGADAQCGKFGAHCFRDPHRISTR